MIKLGQGSTLAAITVSLAPYAVFALMLTVFVFGYFAALARYLWAQPEQQKAMERLIILSANAVVSILTLTPPTLLPQSLLPDQAVSGDNAMAEPIRRS
jgi:hypothetical protein